MSLERWQRIQDVLLAALERAPAARKAFLTEACAGDAELLAEIHSLLQAHEQAGSFLHEAPLSTPAPTSSVPGSTEEIRRLFDEIIDLSSNERTAYLDRARPDDPDQRPNVEALLQAYNQSREMLDRRGPPSFTDAYINQIVSHYQVTEKLGEGGMGVVYKARDTRLDRLVALKFLSPHLSADDEAKARFLREARAASALDHVNICTIHEIGETDAGQVFIAMACYAGETLKKKVSQGALPVEQALNYAVQVAQGLVKAHEQGIVHRDIKPANVMVTEDNVVKLLDFGLAKATDVSQTNTRAVMGTVAYMSPEQARGEPVDSRTDIWSLGVVIYEMLAGQRPFRGGYDQAIIYALLTAQPEPLAGVRAGIPLMLEQIVDKALAKRREERYDDIQEMIGDLQQALVTISGRTRQGAATAAAWSEPTRRIDQEQLLPEGERVQATIVVSNLVGYIDLVEQLSSEDLEHAMRQIQSHAIEVVERHGGIINRFGAEEIAALFGIPASREDDCVRAARAVLELHAWLREGGAGTPCRAIRLRSGIDTGLVVAREGRRADQPYRIVGRPFQTATALALHAEADEVLVSPESRRLLAAVFETEHRPMLRLHGLAESITPARIIGESHFQNLLDAAGHAGLTAHTGREKELETLQGCLQQAEAGEGEFVTVMGEAGLGKSRLLYEFRQRLDQDRVTLVEGRCSSSGDRVSFLPFIEALRDHFRIQPDTPKKDGASRVAARIREITPELDVYLPLYLHLLSIPSEAHPLPEHLEGEHLHLALLEALAAIFTLRTRYGPLVLLLEDWHWSDEASRRVLEQLVELIPAYRFLVVVTYRPEYAPDWGRPAYQTQIRLRPLEETHSVEIMKSTLQAKHLPEPVGVLLHERTGGNPFFLEEICRTLREEGTLQVDEGHVILTRPMEKLKLPNTVEAVIRMRLHRLPPEVRSVLRVASVIGREFTLGLLRHLLEKEPGLTSSLEVSLERLRSAGLIHQTHVLPEATYRFKHVLTQEVAYGSLLHHQRKRTHGLVGQALEERFADRLEEYAEVLAHHFGEAEHGRKAVRYNRLAADRAYRLGQFSEAIALYEQARKGAAQLPEDAERQQTIIELLLRQERLHEAMGEQEQQHGAIDELFALLSGTGDPQMLADTHIRQGELHILQGRFEDGEEALHEALRVSRAHAHGLGEQKALRSMGFLRWHQDRHEEALAINEELLALDRQRGDIDSLMTDLLNLLTVLRRLKDFDGGMAYVEELLVLNDQLDDPVRQPPLYFIIGEFYRGMADNTKALFYMDRGVEVAEQIHHLGALVNQLTIRAQILLELGRFEESIRDYKEVIGMYRSAPSLIRSARSNYLFDLYGLAQPLHMLGEILVALERDEEALPYLEEAASFFARLEDRETEALLRGRVATIHERQERFAEAQSVWEQARALYRDAGNGAGECEALEGLGRTARRQGDMDRALPYYKRALGLAEQTGDQAKEAALHNILGILGWKRETFGDALAHYEQALRIYEDRDEPAHAGLMLNSIGVTLQKLDRPEESIRRLEEAVQRHRRTKQQQLEAHALAALGDAYFEMDRSEEALPYYGASLQLRWDLGDRKGEGWMLQRLARIYVAQGEMERARNSTAQAAAIAEEVGDDELIQTCRRLVE